MTGLDSGAPAADPALAPCLHLFGVTEHDVARSLDTSTPEAASLDAEQSLDAAQLDAAPTPGIDWLRVGRVAVVYESLPPETVAALNDDVLAAGAFAGLAWRHDDVLRRLQALGPVLPIRLSAVSTSLGEIARGLVDAEDSLVEQLDRFRDCAEWTVRARYRKPDRSADTGADDAPRSGRDYLVRRSAERSAAPQRRLIAAFDAVEPKVSACADAVGDLLVEQAGTSVARSYLVRDVRRPTFLAAAADARDVLAAADAEVIVTGPLPAYSFVDLRLQVPA